MPTLADVLPQVLALPRAEKAELARVINADLATTDVYSLVQPGVAYPVRVPDDSFEAAGILLNLIEQKRAGS